MDDHACQERIDILVREAARQLERHKALLAQLEKGESCCELAEARELLRDLEEHFAMYQGALQRRSRAPG